MAGSSFPAVCPRLTCPQHWPTISGVVVPPSKPGAQTEERLFPWYWNTTQEFALADGISCFQAGKVYAHGGLSLQECLTLELAVTAGAAAASAAAVTITDVGWRGLRCTVAIEGDPAGLTADLRTQPGNAGTTVAVAPKPFEGQRCRLVGGRG